MVSVTKQQWIDRLNWIGTLPPLELQKLRDECHARGGHIPSGERFLTTTPLHVCRHCAAKFFEATPMQEAE